ncbi:hypothetical protein [Comamonas testosteroni]|uniref:hypothetical protein n=1 Tax=Comamonas testosteroni TaxID=285 RepID=UPI0012D2D525|nr:hypothetical protein [Comamonas testosteroni]
MNTVVTGMMVFTLDSYVSRGDITSKQAATLQQHLTLAQQMDGPGLPHQRIVHGQGEAQ